MSKRKTLKEIEQAFKERGYTLLSTEYINAFQPLEYTCPHGHKGTISWNSFSNGRGCNECGRISTIKKKTTDYKKVKETLESEGYILLSKEYKNAHEKLDCICPKGHECKIRYNDFRHGHRCRECGKELRSKVQRTNYEIIKQSFEKEGYTLLTKKYTNNKQNLKVKCPNGHEYITLWNRFQQGLRCPICHTSKGEECIKRTLNDLNIEFIYNRYIWKDASLRPDFYLPFYNLVIEFDGKQHFEPIEYFGGEEGFKKRQTKDKEKNDYCKNHNIDILRIPYWDIDKIEKIIKAKLKIN